MTSRLLLRVHDSGDFFSPGYFRALVSAIAERPWITAYGYTKRIDLLKRATLPGNLSLLQSVGGRLDNDIDQAAPHARVFLTTEDRLAAGYRDGNESDLPAIQGQSVGLVYHGTTSVDSVEIEGVITDRGGIRQTDGRWIVTVPTGIKSRRLYVHRFNLIDISDADLGKLITIKTGNAKVKKTARKMSSDGVSYRAGAINLPALASCPMAGACALFCYALQGSFAFRSVRESRARTWAVLHESYRRGGEELTRSVLGSALDSAAPRSAR